MRHAVRAPAQLGKRDSERAWLGLRRLGGHTHRLLRRPRAPRGDQPCPRLRRGRGGRRHPRARIQRGAHAETCVLLWARSGSGGGGLRLRGRRALQRACLSRRGGGARAPHPRRLRVVRACPGARLLSPARGARRHPRRRRPRAGDGGDGVRGQLLPGDDRVQPLLRARHAPGAAQPGAVGRRGQPRRGSLQRAGRRRGARREAGRLGERDRGRGGGAPGAAGDAPLELARALRRAPAGRSRHATRVHLHHGRRLRSPLGWRARRGRELHRLRPARDAHHRRPLATRCVCGGGGYDFNCGHQLGPARRPLRARVPLRLRPPGGRGRVEPARRAPGRGGDGHGHPLVGVGAALRRAGLPALRNRVCARGGVSFRGGGHVPPRGPRDLLRPARAAARVRRRARLRRQVCAHARGGARLQLCADGQPRVRLCGRAGGSRGSALRLLGGGGLPHPPGGPGGRL
mmetsp:Transcript_14483/g.44105  ORF Transcript_14483/g.44105 Transcript_14483/m.44105 type:complete len:459 (+) Transcript_14483:4052-5428(+)